jgi:hypothetical protein
MPERAGHIRLRNRALLDRPNRLAGVAIKHSEKAVLGRPRDDVDFFPFLVIVSSFGDVIRS